MVVVIGVVMLLLLWVFVEFVVGLGTVSPAWREGHDSIELRCLPLFVTALMYS